MVNKVPLFIRGQMALTPLTAWARGQSTSERRLQKGSSARVDTECLELPIWFKFPRREPMSELSVKCRLPNLFGFLGENAEGHTLPAHSHHLCQMVMMGK